MTIVWTLFHAPSRSSFTIIKGEAMVQRKKPTTKAGKKAKVKKVMKEFKNKELKSGKSNKTVKSRKQAIAIALSESGQSRKQMQKKRK